MHTQQTPHPTPPPTRQQQVVFIDTVLLAQEAFYASFKREVAAGLVRFPVVSGGWIGAALNACVDSHLPIYILTHPP